MIQTTTISNQNLVIIILFMYSKYLHLKKASREPSQPTENSREPSQPTENSREPSQPTENSREPSQPTENSRESS